MAYTQGIIILALVYSILTVSLNIVCGYAGLFSLAQAAFFGVGAYTAAILLTYFHSPFLIALVAGTLLAGIGGILIGIPTLRLKGDYLLIATLGFGEILQSIFKNARLTGGSGGISNIPPPVFFGFVIDTDLKYIILLALFLAAVMYFAWCLKASPMGTVLRAIRYDEILVSSIGRNPYKFKIIAFIASALIAGSCGVIYASYVTYISPSNFALSEAILIFSMMIFGGVGSISGSLLGASVLVLLPEVLRFVGLPTEFAANLRQMMYGVLLIAIMFVRPRGLMGEFKV